MAISNEWDVVHEADIDFEDAAGRCAQLLHLRRTAAPTAAAESGEEGSSRAVVAAGGDEGESGAPSELLVANVHLLFPHNEAAARIRVREVHKLLAYIDSYKSTLPRPPPALICGDFNGEAASTVVQFLKRYGWRCSYSQHAEVCDSADAAASVSDAAAASRSSRWVSHYTHEKEALGVDYIWVLNPSLPRLPVPEWTDFVFSEMAQQLTRQGFSRPADAWLYFHRLASSSSSAARAASPLEVEQGNTLLDAAADVAAQVPLDAAGFRRALRKLDLERGDALGTLTEAEVQMLISSCDLDGDNCVDGQEWCDRFGAALQRLSGEGESPAVTPCASTHTRARLALASRLFPPRRLPSDTPRARAHAGLLTDAPDGSTDLHVEHSQLTPPCLEEGVWPAAEDWGLSDHGIVTSRFVSNKEYE